MTGATARAVLRERLDQGTVVCPGAMNAFFARIIEQAGFDAVYMSGAGVAHGLLGAPDLGLTTLTEMAQAAQNMCAAVGIPVVADADTGFGGTANVERTVRLYEQAGVAAIQLEDQVSPKRCGHLAGAEVVEPGVMIARIRAARAARTDPALVLVVRTDARAAHGLDEALRRAHAYAEAGADALFVEAPVGVEELRRIGRELASTGLPLVANMVEGGRTPLLSARELGELGFRLVIFPGLVTRVTAKAARDALAVLHETGDSRLLRDRFVELAEIQTIVGTAELQARVTELERER